MESEIVIRRATKWDMEGVAEMIQELADFEEMSDGPQISTKDLQLDGFGKQPPAFYCLVAERLSSMQLVGYALYFPTYSTWQGRALMLEDLYVRPTDRMQGVGLQLFNAVAKEACAAGGTRLDFHVLRWNPARAFYERAGARDLTAAEDWTYFRLAGPALAAAAAAAPELAAVPASTSASTAIADKQ